METKRREADDSNEFFNFDSPIIQKEREKNKENRWIPCSERLPEDGEKIIVYGKRYFIPDHSDELDWKYATWIITFHKWLLDEHEIIAWMPIQPYKAEGSDEE